MKLLALSAACLAIASAQSNGIVRADAGLDRIVPANAKLEKVADGFVFTEGPVWAHAGYLLFSDIPRNVIVKWTPDGKTSTFREKSGYSGTATFPPKFPIGSNGLTIDKRRGVIVCETANRRLSRIDPNGKLTVLAERYEGKRLNSPNDVVVKSDGSIYFTDPPYGLVKQDADAAKELDFSGVYRLAGGKLQLLTKELNRPNGLTFSPDEKRLYVANSDEKNKFWQVYDVRADGSLANGKKLYDVSNAPAEGLPDGMKVDRQGNVYATGPGGVWIFSPEGKHLGTISTPEVPTNVAWGDADGKTLYITAQTSLYRIRLNVNGPRP